MMRNKTTAGGATAQADRLPRRGLVFRVPVMRHLNDAYRYPSINLVNAHGDDLLACRQPA